jgi:hypothetical protein
LVHAGQTDATVILSVDWHHMALYSGVPIEIEPFESQH